MRDIEILVLVHHAGVSHMEPAAGFTVQERDWSKPDGQRTRILGVFGASEREAAHALARSAGRQVRHVEICRRCNERPVQNNGQGSCDSCAQG